MHRFTSSRVEIATGILSFHCTGFPWWIITIPDKPQYLLGTTTPIKIISRVLNTAQVNDHRECQNAAFATFATFATLALRHDAMIYLLAMSTENPLSMEVLPSGKHTQNYGKSPFSMGKSTINGHSIAMFVYQRVMGKSSTDVGFPQCLITRGIQRVVLNSPWETVHFGSNGVYHTSGMVSNLIWSGTNKDGTISTAK